MTHFTSVLLPVSDIAVDLINSRVIVSEYTLIIPNGLNYLWS